MTVSKINGVGQRPILQTRRFGKRRSLSVDLDRGAFPIIGRRFAASSSPMIAGNIFFVGNTCDTQFSPGVISFHNFSSPHIINNLLILNPCTGINLLSRRALFPWLPKTPSSRPGSASLCLLK